MELQCKIPGSTFKTQAALTRHNRKYHPATNPSHIPSSLRALAWGLGPDDFQVRAQSKSPVDDRTQAISFRPNAIEADTESTDAKYSANLNFTASDSAIEYPISTETEFGWSSWDSKPAVIHDSRQIKDYSKFLDNELSNTSNDELSRGSSVPGVVKTSENNNDSLEHPMLGLEKGSKGNGDGQMQEKPSAAGQSDRAVRSNFTRIQLELMRLEQQNKKRLMMARLEQDNQGMIASSGRHRRLEQTGVDSSIHSAQSGPGFWSRAQTPTEIITCCSLSIGAWRKAGRDGRDLLIYYSLGKEPTLTYSIDDPPGYRIQIPFSYIRNITIHDGHLANTSGHPTRPAGLTVELICAPIFYTRYSSGDFHPCGDFTEDHQATYVKTHYLEGDTRTLGTQIAKLTALDSFRDRHIPYHF